MTSSTGLELLIVNSNLVSTKKIHSSLKSVFMVDVRFEHTKKRFHGGCEIQTHDQLHHGLSTTPFVKCKAVWTYVWTNYHSAGVLLVLLRRSLTRGVRRVLGEM